VDFRELVKDLVSVFKTRIELRQIGVRDESRVLGGLGVCGRKFCCHSLTDKLNPVSIKMAKEQNLSLNSMKISGPCGRLLCCLSYEYDFYKEEKSRLPSEGNRIRTEQEEFRVADVNILTKRITLTGKEGNAFDAPFSRFQWDEERKRWWLLPENSVS
jgi:cell fate regulator YaaT (PSP1 superfamily)